MDKNSASPPHLKLVSDLLCAISSYAKKAKRNVSGQAILERYDEPEPPMVVMYHTNDEGNYLVWFADQGKMYLYTMIGGTVKRQAAVLTKDFPKLQKKIDELRPTIDKEFKPKKKKKS